MNLNENMIIKSMNQTAYEELSTDETLFALGNGKLGSRAHFAEGYGIFDYPQTLINGFYNTHRLKYEENYKQFPQIGQTIVNVMDASYIKVELGDETIDLAHQTLIHLERNLNLGNGTYERHATYLTKNGWHIDIHEIKRIHPKDLHMVTQLNISSKDYEGPIKLSSFLRMPLDKQANPLDPRLPVYYQNLEHQDSGYSNRFAYMTAKTTQTHAWVGVGMKHEEDVFYHMNQTEVIGTLNTTLQPQKTVTLTKHAYYELKDLDHLTYTLENDALTFQKMDELNTQHYLDFWRDSWIECTPKEIELAYRFQMFQLAQSGCADEKTSVAAKGLSGEGYDGHFFWDAEMYVLPYYALTKPNKAKNILMFRYHTLDQARAEARKLGIPKGAKIPWRTINGDEASSYFPAGSSQVHINSDVAYAIYMYMMATRDETFLKSYGLEILIETAMFILEYGHFNQDRFHIFGVTGPDEYTAIVNDNYYTNRMAKFHLNWVYELVVNNQDYLRIYETLGYDQQSLESLKLASDQMTLNINDALYVIEQDDAFLGKKPLDINTLPKEVFPLLLNYHPQFIYKHQVLKQADAIIGAVLFQDLDQNLYENTFDYYLAKTTHDSSLSKCVYGMAAYHIGRTDLAFEYLKNSVFLDLHDLKKYTSHGLHVANLGGSYLMLIYGLLGFKWDRMLNLKPRRQKDITFKIHMNYQNQIIQLTLSEKSLLIEVEQPIEIMLDHTMYMIENTMTYPLK